MRYRNGEIMARDEVARGKLPKLDFVAGVPDSGVPHAIGFANRSGKPFARPFVKYTPTWPRSFMPTSQDVRNQVAKMKQIPVPELIEGKKLLFVDDSIVRAPSCGRRWTFSMRAARRRSTCARPVPPSCTVQVPELLPQQLRHGPAGPPDRPGTGGDEGQQHLEEYADASTERGQCMLRAICEKLGFDSLGYQSLDGLLEAIGNRTGTRSAPTAGPAENNDSAVILCNQEWGMRNWEFGCPVPPDQISKVSFAIPDS